MLVIPVLDIMGGLVVHARGGHRSSYRPIETPLAPGRSDPVSILRGYRALHPFPIVYIADLDGIGRREPDVDAVHALRAAFPGLEIWLDDGGGSAEIGGRHSAPIEVRRVVGSETLASIGDYLDLRDARHTQGILSLDFRGDSCLGPAELFERPELWPHTVIVMTLARVGAGQGPDTERVREIRKRAGGARQVFAAGGVRDAGDLAALASAGASGALVASALHAGTIKAGDLAEIAGPG